MVDVCVCRLVVGRPRRGHGARDAVVDEVQDPADGRTSVKIEGQAALLAGHAAGGGLRHGQLDEPVEP